MSRGFLSPAMMMPIPVRDTFPTDRDDLLVLVTDDGSRTLLRSGSDDSFHSGCGAASETRHVYLANSGVADRLQRQQSTRVLEVGLGTTMALLMTVELAVQSETQLHYLAFETDWISTTTLAFLNPNEWGVSPRIIESYAAFRGALPERVSKGSYTWNVDEHRAATFLIQDFRTWDTAAIDPVDAIYFDPFCPNSAPELWTAESFAMLRPALREKGWLATYSCSRSVRTALGQADWEIRRVPGPEGGKREVIVARPSDDSS